MKEKLLLSAICCILFLNGAHSQSELSLPEEGIVVYEHNLNAFLVINDSTSYHTYVSGKWTEHPYQFISDAFSFEKFKNDFVPISVKGRGMYFVHKGCGMTYTLKNDTLQRIDKSFAHKSQYHGTVFSVSNNLYFFGGYGIFTEKNYTVAYDFQTDEWYKIEIDGELAPKPRFNCISQVKHGNLYVIGGKRQKNTSKLQSFNDVWRLNLKSRKWKKLGTISSPKVKHHLDYNYSACATSPYLFVGKSLIHMDVTNNTCTYYENGRLETISRIIEDPNSDALLMVRRTSKNRKLYCYVSSVEEILTDPVKKTTLYTLPTPTENKFNVEWWFILLLVSFFIYFSLSKFVSRQFPPPNLEDELSIPIGFLSAIEKDVLLLLLENKNGILISDVNIYLDEENLSYSALKKRRETFMRVFRSKLSEVSNLLEQEVLVEVKSAKDRRLKIIWLHPTLYEKLSEIQAKEGF